MHDGLLRRRGHCLQHHCSASGDEDNQKNYVANAATMTATLRRCDAACVAGAAPVTTMRQQSSVVLTMAIQRQRDATCIVSAATMMAT